MLTARFSASRLALALLLLLQLAANCAGLQIDLGKDDTIKNAAAKVAANMMEFYHGDEPGQPIGMLPGPYYWWEAGAMWGTLVEYYYYTGDTTYNKVVTEALLAQVGADNDYEPVNVTKQLGNDDQAFWAFAAMSAAELNFPDPPKPEDPQWLALAQAVFNRQAQRWDMSSCGGGLRWQIFPFNNGYNYKNSVSNGAFFQLAARLYRYTGNETYGNWANKTYDWMLTTPLISKEFHVFDGSSTKKNCTDVDPHEWTYNVGMFIAGTAFMYNATNGSKFWQDRLTGFINASNVFFPGKNAKYGNVMVEVACEPYNTCNVDQPSFKAYLSRWMAVASQLAPYAKDLLIPRLQASAQGAAEQCVGGPAGTTCGRFWNSTVWSGHNGVGEQMSALSIIQTMMIGKRPPPVTANTGGTSKGDPNAGSKGGAPPTDIKPIKQADKVGAGILTAIMLILTGVTAYFLVI